MFSLQKGDKILFKDLSKGKKKYIIGDISFIDSEKKEYIIVVDKKDFYHINNKNIIYHVNKTNISNEHKLYNGEIRNLFFKFIKKWKEDWKRFCFRKVQRVVLDDKNFFNMSYEYLSGKHNREILKSIKNEDEVPLNYKFSIKKLYHQFFGFTTNKNLAGDDNKYLKEIYFGSCNYSCLDLNVSITGSFTKHGIHGGSFIPPKEGDIICGLTKERPDGRPFMVNWFISSPEFYKLWCIVTGYQRFEKITNFDNFIKKFETGQWMSSGNTNLPMEERINYLKMKPSNCEPYSIDWCHIYKALICLYYGKFEYLSDCFLPKDFIKKFISNVEKRHSDRIYHQVKHIQ